MDDGRRGEGGEVGFEEVLGKFCTFLGGGEKRSLFFVVDFEFGEMVNLCGAVGTHCSVEDKSGVVGTVACGGVKEIFAVDVVLVGLLNGERIEWLVGDCCIL
jgi:hypothetical protein